MLADIAEALWYILHMPRNAMDVIFAPDWFFVEGDVMHQHNLFIISSERNEANIDVLTAFPPTLYISEASCYEEAASLNDEYPAELGCIDMQILSSDLLSGHWASIKEKVDALLTDHGIDMKARKMLNVSPRLLADHEQSALPNVFLANQIGDTETMLQFFEKSGYSLKARVHGTKRQLTYFHIWDQLGGELEKVNDGEIIKAVNSAYRYTPSPLVLTLPGGPRSRQSYGLDSHKYAMDEKEKNLIRFLGVHRAISQQGVWLEGGQLHAQLFHKLDQLERHFRAAFRKPAFILRTMKEFGQLLAQCLGIENLGEYALASSRIIAFTDFPVGLAIPPGYSDPLCSMTAISYRPLTPLTQTFKNALRPVDDYYIGRGRGFTILILECLSESERIRKSSDLGWAVMRDQLANDPLITVEYKVVHSIEELEDQINACTNIDFLIISAHGRYNQDGVAGLDVHGEFWLPRPSLNVPPVIILSACRVATKGRGNFTINDAFLNAGALAVLGPLIPVDVVEDAALTQRLFYYISETLQGHHDCLDLAEAWRRVMNMNIFFSVLNSSRKLAKWSFTKNGKNKTAYETFFEKLRSKGEKPGELHLQTVEILKEVAVESGMKEYLEIVLNRYGYISESIFYTFSGYPEKVLIQPKRWMQKR